MATEEMKDAKEALEQGSSKRKVYMTLCGLPVSMELEWPFRASSSGADLHSLHARVWMEGTEGLHADVAVNLTQVMLHDVFASLEPRDTESAAVNAVRRHRGLAELDAMEFLDLVRRKMKLVRMPDELLYRSVNEGFSGGEKKRNEIFQMAVLEPRLAVLDETDSGLDIDALKTVAEAVNKLRSPKNATVVVTHYQRLLNYIVPDFVHVLVDGRIVRSGGKELALELEEKGYDWLRPETAVAR